MKSDKKSDKNKTNAMRVLDKAGISYITHTCDSATGLTGVQIAELMGENPDQAFKTLVTVGASKNHYVFIIPVALELNLKAAAKAAGEKSIAMIPQKELLPLTGYIHGGCSPIGMKKLFRTFLYASADLYDTICVSAGKVGMQVELDPQELKRVVPIEMIEY